MKGRERSRLTRILTVVGVSVAIGALLVLALLPAASSAARLQRQAELATSDATCAAGENPVVPGYDPVTHEIYVPNEGAGGSPSITVYNETCQLVGSVTPSLPSDSRPWQAAFDPENNYMYVTDYGLSEVYVISGTTILDTITGFDAPVGITYDPTGYGMAVVNSGNNRVDFIYGTTTASVEFGFFTGSDPYEITYDPTCAGDLVTNTASDNVTVYEDTSRALYSLPVGSSPEGIAYAGAEGEDYVANAGSNTVSVLLCTLGVEFTITGFHQPDAVAWDQATLHIYVTNVGNGKVYVVSGESILKKDSTASDSGASGLAFDEFDDEMYVTGYDNDEVYVLS